MRHSVGWDPSPEVADREIQGALASDGYRAGARVLAQMGLLLETALYFPQLDELADFATAIPELTIAYSYNVMVNAFKRLSQGYSATERAAMFHDTVVRVYRIET